MQGTTARIEFVEFRYIPLNRIMFAGRLWLSTNCLRNGAGLVLARDPSLHYDCAFGALQRH